MLFVLRFAQVKEGFRRPELESVFDILGLDATRLDGLTLTSPFCIVELPDISVASGLLKRAVLLFDAYRMFAKSDSFSGLLEKVKDVDFSEYVDKPFRFKVDAFMKTFSESEQLSMINSFSFMPLRGSVRLKDDSASTFTILYDHTGGSWMFGEKVFVDQSMRSRVDCYSLKKRDYLGTTSMDAELGLIMANVARVSPGTLVYDPFVGTGSLMFAAAHFGAFTVGSDIDGRQMRGGRPDENGRGSLHSNIAQYGMHDRVLGGLVADICHHPWRDNLRLFDAIICDPPYGVRAGAKRIAKIGDRNVPPHLHHILYPTTAPYELDDLTRDLLALAASYLAPGGRLVFWYPQDVKEKIFDPSGLFSHHLLSLKFSIPQQMRMICRWLLVYEKTHE